MTIKLRLRMFYLDILCLAYILFFFFTNVAFNAYFPLVSPTRMFSRILYFIQPEVFFPCPIRCLAFDDMMVELSLTRRAAIRSF